MFELKQKLDRNWGAICIKQGATDLFCVTFYQLRFNEESGGGTILTSISIDTDKPLEGVPDLSLSQAMKLGLFVMAYRWDTLRNCQQTSYYHGFPPAGRFTGLTVEDELEIRRDLFGDTLRI